MATKSDFKQAQERIFARPRPESKSDQELLRKTEDDGVYPSPLNVQAIRVDRIRPGNQASCSPSDTLLVDLAQVLRTQGQVIPVLVRYDSDEDVFILIYGERCWQAAQQAGLQTLQAVILGRLSPAESYEKQVAAALQQDDWRSCNRSPALEAYKLLKGIETWPGVAEQLGISDATLQALLCAAPPAEDVSDAEPASVIETAMRRLDRVIASLPADDPASKPLLADLSARLAVQRKRVQQAIAGAPGEPKRKAAEPGARPVRRLPTWGDR